MSQTSGTGKYAARVPENILTPDAVESHRLGELNFFDGLPSAETVEKVYDQLDFARGVEAFLSGIPAASVYAFLEGLKQAGIGPFEMGITEQLLDARSLWLTPNTTTMYCLTEIDVKNGPVVMEVPPAVVGPVDDAYFRWVTDIGVTGPDQGQGGKYLFVHNDDDGELPDGYFVARTPTYRHFLLMRAFVIDGDLAKTVESVKARWRIYPLAEAADPREPTFVNLSGKYYNTIHANDFTFFDELNAVVQYEPADAFNPEHVGLWASIGIKKGQPFEPDARMKTILVDAAAVANATARALSFAPRGREQFIYPDRNWVTPFVGGRHDFTRDGEMMLDYRTFLHYMATGITPAMAQTAVGKGSAYAWTPRSADGEYLDGAKSYTITLPGPVPAADFWSFAVYSGQHRGLLETDQALAGVDSNHPEITANNDGSYTIWFSPEPPPGREGNWVQTLPGKSWSVILRLYGPLEPWFDQTWKPGDVEPIN